MHSVKTAISVKDAFFREPRQREVLEQLNRVYDGQPDPLAPKMKARFHTVIQDKW